MEQNHLISIIVPTHNRENFIRKSLDSLLNQTYKNIEIIVVHNESTDNTGVVLEEYERKDTRIKIINQKDKGYGGGVNVGLENANGDYIAILEADDWAASDMYEKLLKRALETNADIVKSSFYYVRNEECTQLEECKYWYGMDKGLKVFNIKEVPDIVRYFASLWSCLYKKSFIDKYHIRMIETPQATYQDFSWMAATYANAEKISILEEPLYYYLRTEKPDTTSYYTDEKVFYMPYHCEEARKIFIKANVFDYVKEQYYIHAFRSCQLFGKNIEDKLKEQYYTIFRNLLKKAKKDKIKFQYFTQEEKYIVKKILYKNFLNKTTYRNKNKYKAAEYIISVKNSPDKKHKVVMLFGIKLKFKKRQPLEARLRNIIREEVSFITAREISNAIAIAKLHSRTFPRFKNIHKNNSIAIFGGGPTMEYYQKELSCINIALNHLIFKEDIDFSYLFNWDYQGTIEKAPDYYEKIKTYNCKKFFGRFQCGDFLEYPDLPDDQEKGIYHFYSSARHHLPAYNYGEILHYDIETHPLTDFMSVSFAAIQFALYTHPQKIYLIGLDTTQTGHYLGYNNLYHIGKMLTGYKKLKKFVGIYYPDIEIISVNPVGLKGLFKDVYTQSYVDAHPELKNENIEILKPELCETALHN